MVEPVYGDTVAGLDRRFRIGHYTRERREGSIDASNHCQVLSVTTNKRVTTIFEVYLEE